MTNVSAPLGLDMFYRQASCGIWSQPVWVTGDITPVSTGQQTTGRLWQKKQRSSPSFAHIEEKFLILVSFHTRWFSTSAFVLIYTSFPLNCVFPPFILLFPLACISSIILDSLRSSHLFLFYSYILTSLTSGSELLFLSLVVLCPLATLIYDFLFLSSPVFSVSAFCFFFFSLSFMLFQSEQNDDPLPFTVSLSPFLTHFFLFFPSSFWLWSCNDWILCPSHL